MSLLSGIHNLVRSSTFIKFCIIGIVNCIVGFSIILSMIYIFNINYLISNLAGYICGLMTSFFLNKYVNFRSDGKVKVELPIFLGSFLIAYSVNAVVLYSLVDLFHQPKIAGLIVAAAVYTVLFYFSSRFFVFIKRHETS